MWRGGIKYASRLFWRKQVWKQNLFNLGGINYMRQIHKIMRMIIFSNVQFFSCRRKIKGIKSWFINYEIFFILIYLHGTLSFSEAQNLNPYLRLDLILVFLKIFVVADEMGCFVVFHYCQVERVSRPKTKRF